MSRLCLWLSGNREDIGAQGVDFYFFNKCFMSMDAGYS